ncbi:MAG: hypothetical protein HY334_04325 [Armatimonadetes bacterium]|nr:hypothetical protein [Armatimonadota bacterium]
MKLVVVGVQTPGAQAYLTKPLDVKQFLSFVDDVLNEGEALSITGSARAAG